MKKNKEKPDLKIEFETFRKPGYFAQKDLTQKSPDCFNGEVAIRKYKITFELVDESWEVLIERLRKLWSECDNLHHWNPLQSEAKKLGIELKMEDLPKRY